MSQACRTTTSRSRDRDYDGDPFDDARAAGLIITGVMVAVSTGQNGFIILGGLGYEYNLVLITIALALVIAGPGQLSLDYQLGLDQAVADRVRRSRTNHG